MEYLGIEAIGLLEETDPMRWNNQKNPDNFFRNVYYYYENHGLPAIILSQVCLTFSLAFTIGLSIFMIAFINWNGIINCSDEETCSADDFVKNPFNQSPSSFMFFTVIYFVLFGSLWTYKTFLALKVIKNAIEMEQFYREILGIKLNELLVMKWHEVIDRIILLHENNSYRVTMKDKLTPHDIASYIMRKDNYLIALINRSLLDLRVPWFLLPFMSEELFLTESLEVSLSFCIFEYMFTDQYDISHDFINDIEGMKWRFQAVGIMNLLLLPFMLVYLVLQFFLSNAQQFHTSRTYLGPRQWSPLALLKFREFNELPHIFRERMNGSVLPANSYLSNFRNYYIETIAKTCMFITGAFLSMLLLSSFLSGEVLLHGHIGEHNLLWFLGIFTAIYAGANSFMPDESKQPEDSEMLMQKICSHTHYYPDHWVGKAKTWDVRDEFCELFQYKASLFFMEIMSSILTPIILCFSLPSSSAVVLEFIRDHSKYVEGVGAVCDYCLFDFDRYGDDKFGAEKSGYLDETQRPVDGKMEKSFLSFQHAYPNYESGAGAKGLLQKLSLYKNFKKHDRNSLLTQAIHQSLGINTADSSNQQSLMASNPNEKFVPLYEENTVTSTPSSPKVRSDLPPRDNSPIVSYIGKDELIDSMADGTGAFAAKPQFSNVRPTGAPVGAGISLIMPSNIPEEHGLPSFYGSPDRVHGDSILVSTSPRGQQSSRLDIHSTNYSSGNSSTGRRDLPGVLRSILKKENIDYENDFYWLTKFQHEKKRNPAALERSLLASSRLDFSPTLSGFPMFDLRNSSSSIAEPSQINPAFALDHSAAQRPDGVPNSYSPELPFVSNVQTSMHTNDTDDGNSLGKDINV